MKTRVTRTAFLLSNVGPVGPPPDMFVALGSEEKEDSMSGEGSESAELKNGQDTFDYDSVLVAGKLKGWLGYLKKTYVVIHESLNTYLFH